MSRIVHVHLLPDLIPADAVAGKTAVIIDVLRASSTIVTALDHGAIAVLPCGDPTEAKRLRNSSPGEPLLLGGERHGVRIEGFDLGNSPAEYTPEVVAGRRIVFTTTNGTRALLKCRGAAQIVIGCWLNLQRLTSWLAAQALEIHLVCAGTDGIVSGEDVLAAGAMVQQLAALTGANLELNDSAAIARGAAVQLLGPATDDRARLADYFANTQGGRNLIAIRQHSDLPLCAAISSSQCVPLLDPSGSELRQDPTTQ
ncbi:MAG: putative 2-phosphosulfolactate phosphatase [Planctomycetota bacterium]